MAKGIRSYGPGKYSKIIDSYAYDVAIDGALDEEESYPDGGGWYGLLLLDKQARDAIRQAGHYAEDDLTKDEKNLLDDSAAVIFFERSDGIVEVDWFENKQEALDAWTKIEEEFAEPDEDEPEEDDEAFSEEEMREGYVISDGRRGGYDVAHSGRSAGHYSSVEDALDAISDKMEKDQFFPNIYFVNDHGNVDLIDANGKIIQSRV